MIDINFLKPKFASMTPRVIYLFKVVLAFVVIGVIASFSSGVLSVFNSYVDPVTVLAYVVVAYLLGHYYHLTLKQSYFYFIFAVLLGFTIPLVTGSIFLILIIPAFRLLKIISPPEA